MCLYVRAVAAGAMTWDPRRGTMLQVTPPRIFTSERRDVTAVLVLYGLPRDLTASILAHEAMHVWLKLSKHMPFTLPPKVEEGLCQVIAMKYLEQPTAATLRRGGGGSGKSGRGSGGGGGSGDTSNDVMRAYYRSLIETDPSPVYGDGYREAAACCGELGVDVVLEYVKDTKSLPCIR